MDRVWGLLAAAPFTAEQWGRAGAHVAHVTADLVTSVRNVGTAAAHRYPSIRPGGLMIVLLGLATAAAAVAAHVQGGSQVMSGLFWPGLVVSIAAQVVFRRRLAYGQRSRGQTRRLRAGMAVLAIGLVAAALGLHAATSRTLWLVVLVVVGVHFLPMGPTHGVRIVALGVVCTTAAVIGLVVPALPFLVIASVDAAAKILTGAGMLAQRPTPVPQPAI